MEYGVTSFRITNKLDSAKSILNTSCCSFVFVKDKQSKFKAHLMILQLSTNNTKSLLNRVLVDMDFRESRGRTRWYPLFVNIVVHHHTRPGAGYRLFTATQTLLLVSHIKVDQLQATTQSLYAILNAVVQQQTQKHIGIYESYTLQKLEASVFNCM